MTYKDNPQTEILVVGDVVLNRDEPNATFELVQAELSKGDMLVGNYEAALSNAGEQAKFRPWSNFLYSPPEMVDGLTEAGFDVVSLANNQSMNYGPEGILDTIELLREHHIGYVGAGVDAADAEQAYSQSINGIDIGVVAFESTWWDWKATQAGPNRTGLNQISTSPYFSEPYISGLDLERMCDLIETAAHEHDVLVALFHFGIEGEHQHTVTQTELAHKAIESGADAVIGTHSHVLQAIEVYQSSPIFYSLGNFAFDRPDTWALDLMSSETALVNLKVDDEGIFEALVQPVVYDHGPQKRPKVVAPGSEKYTEISQLLLRLSERTGTTLEVGKECLHVPL